MSGPVAGGSGRHKHRRRRAKPMSDINVTPLVDVMLVLLIVFMVTAPLLSAGVPVDLPEAQAKPYLDAFSVIVSGGSFTDDEARSRVAAGLK